jgi:hypothetical protein
MVAHTSNVFATDLAAGKWGQVTANQTAATTSASLQHRNYQLQRTVQAAVAGTRRRASSWTVSIVNRELFNGL